jgi:hypothetical protein
MYSKHEIPPSPLLLSTVVEHKNDKLLLDQITTQSNIQSSNTKEIGQHIITDNIDTVILNNSIIGINHTHTSTRSATNSKPTPQQIISQRQTVLKTWFIKHIFKPYPTEKQKHQFMLELNMTKDQGNR